MSEAKINRIEDLLNLPKGKSVVEQDISRLTAPGENYGSLILKVDLKIDGNYKEEFLHLVAKCVPPNKEMQEIFDIHTTFKKEIGWYSQVIPTFQAFQRRNGVENVLNCFPKLYGSRLSLKPESNTVDNDGVILLENIGAQDYKLGNRLEGFDLKITKEILSNLATIHAVFTALRIKDPEVFQAKIAPLLKTNMRPPPPFGPGVLAFIEKEKPEFHHLSQRIQNTFSHSLYGSGEFREPWITVNHNDLWVNNILLRLTDKSTDVMILDFQICGSGSPVLDLVFFLTTSVALPVLKTHFDELIKFYYEQFFSNFKKLNVDTNIFTYQGLENELKKEGKSNFIHSLFFALIVLIEKKEVADSTNQNFDPNAFILYLVNNINLRQREKIYYLVEEFAKRNWI